MIRTELRERDDGGEFQRCAFPWQLTLKHPFSIICDKTPLGAVSPRTSPKSSLIYELTPWCKLVLRSWLTRILKANSHPKSTTSMKPTCEPLKSFPSYKRKLAPFNSKWRMRPNAHGLDGASAAVASIVISARNMRRSFPFTLTMSFPGIHQERKNRYLKTGRSLSDIEQVG